MELNHTNVAIYRGTKELKAWPMSRDDYNTYRGWPTPPEEDGSDAGYLVEYLDGGKPNDGRHSGYISWSPADVFEKTYYRVDVLAAQAAETEALWQARNGRGQALSLAVQLGAAKAINPADTLDAAKLFQTFLADPPAGTWQERLEAERADLHDRRGKLNDFIGSPQFGVLPERVRNLLAKQYVLMDELYGVLVERQRD